jgi:hypothetical protein
VKRRMNPVLVGILGALLALALGVVDFARAEDEDVDITNASWTCTSEVDIDLVRVTINDGSSNDAIRLGQNCSGRIGRIEVTTNGLDGVKVLNSGTVASNLTIEGGFIRCTNPASASADGIQAMGGTNIVFQKLRVHCGDGDDSVIAQFHVAKGGSNASTPTGIVCEDCHLGPDGTKTVLLGESVSSGIRETVVCPGDNQDFDIETGATTPVDSGNQIVAETDPICDWDGPDCSLADATRCVPGSTLAYTDQRWTCNAAVSSYGTLPVKVVLDYTATSDDHGAFLGADCSGDSDPDTIDLILDVRGDGKTYGPGLDAVRVSNASPGASHLQITGSADCGRQGAGADGVYGTGDDGHQDGVQAIGGTDITWVDFEVGDYDAGIATCQGAGGGMFYSGSATAEPDDMHVLRGSYIACNTAIRDEGGDGTIHGAKGRSGRYDESTGLCMVPEPCTGTRCGEPYFSPRACDLDNLAVVDTDVYCEHWNDETLVWEEETS